jgi:hypothetical protein
MNAGEDGSVIVGKILEKDQYAYGFDSDRQVRQPGRQRHHRSDQGGSRSDPERGLGRGSLDHQRSHGGRGTEEEHRRRYACRWRHVRHGWYGFLGPPVQRSKEKEKPGSDARPFCIFVRLIAVALLNLPQAEY